MAVWQVETGGCTGRGFSAVNADGFLAKFYTYITKAAGAGGPGWTILLDKSASPSAKGWTDASVNTATDGITINSHGFYTGERVVLSTDGTLPGGLSSSTYYVINVSANIIKLATSLANAYDGTCVNLTSAGSGTSYATLEGPYIIVSDQAAPAINEVCFVFKIGYVTSEAGYIRVQQFLGWDDTNKIPIGVWDGRRVTTLDASDFAYDFRGGAEGMIIQARIGESWTTAGIDTFTGSTNFLEADTVVTTTTAQASAGSSVSIEVTDSSNFSAENYYFVVDLSSTPIVNYVYCDSIPDGTHIQVTTLYDTFPSGAVIGAYPHRYYTFGTTPGSYGEDLNYSGNYSKLPYCSAADGRVFHNQSTYIYGQIRTSKMTNAILTHDPGDDNKYAVQKPFLCEDAGENQNNYTTGMNRVYGTGNNVYLTSNTSLSAQQDGRTVGGSNYLFFQTEVSVFTSGSGSLACCFLDTESAS